MGGVAGDDAGWSAGDPGVDRPYGDLPGMPYSVDSVEDCYQQCIGNSTCAAWAAQPSSCSSSGSTLCWLKNMVMPQVYVGPEGCRVSGVHATQASDVLLPRAYEPVPANQVALTGWNLDWMKVQAEGLAGHLQEFWADIENSTWIGGNADPGLHERMPYWLNGMVGTAFYSQNPALQATVAKTLSIILSKQNATSGWLGPTDDPSGAAYWSRFPLLLALVQYAEVNETAAPEIFESILHFVEGAHIRMFEVPLTSWSQYRGQDFALTLQYLLENAPQNKAQVLYDAAELAWNQSFAWGAFMSGDSFPRGPVPASEANLANHGVNVGQGLKAAAVWYRQSMDPTDAAAAKAGEAQLFKYHGLAHGVFGSDEHLAGSMPSRGTELCTVVETAFSEQELFSILGDEHYLDRAEHIYYNALPAELDPSMWSHQYLQQTNQFHSVVENPHPWATDGPDAVLFGLAPNYGCCTANFDQGLGKRPERMIYYETKSGNIALTSFSPFVATLPISQLARKRLAALTRSGATDKDLTAFVAYLDNERIPSKGSGSLRAGALVVNVSGSYPFGSEATITLSGSIPTPLAGLNISFRVPGWADGAVLTIPGGQQVPTTPQTLVSVAATQGVYRMNFATRLRTQRGFNNAASLFWGDVMFALPIGEHWEQVQHYYMNSSLWNVLNTTQWQQALILPQNADPNDHFQVTVHSIPKPVPFITGPYPITLQGKSRSLPWGVDLNSVAPPPQSPVCSTSGTCGDPQDIVLVPYGSTDLRIGAFPTTEQ